MKRQRGMTLVELMIAMVLASIVSAFVLMITRSQLIAYEQNDQITRMQQNERAGVSFVEGLLRRACGGIAYGKVGLGVGASQTVVNCVTVYDGAKVLNSGSFANDSPADTADAVEIIYGTSPFTSVNVPCTTDFDPKTTPSVDVADKDGFKRDDYVLLTDYKQAVLMKVASVTAGATSPQGTLNFTQPLDGAALVGLPIKFNCNITVMKAVTESIYLQKDKGSVYGMSNLLMLDPDGIVGTSHDDAQPLVENVADFQVEMGIDADANGTLTDGYPSSMSTDEWWGNVSGELSLPVDFWNMGAGYKQLRALRASFIFMTSNVYPGSAPTLPPFGDRSAASLPTPGGGTPRYRPARVTVAPRVWNLTN